jgi:hypothetical protein
MYRQGLGDCFLLTVPGEDAEAHVLIDCGVLMGTKEAAARMRSVAHNIAEITNGVIDVLVVTHEHWDHVSGFLQAEEIFNRMTIRELWLAWTESDDDLAKELRNRKAKTLRAVAAAAGRLRGMTAVAAQRSARRLDGLLQFYGGMGVAGRKTTSDAMEWIKARDTVRTRFLYPGRETLDIAGLSSVRAYVLGPPYNQDMIRKSRPSKRNSEVYQLTGDSGSDFGFMTAIEDPANGSDARQQPFERWFMIGKEDSTSHPFFSKGYWGESDDWRRIEDDWLEVAGRLALHLDSDTNNTSLVLAFELRNSGRVLLFPGDAQVGNWLSWEPLKWTVKEGPDTRTISTNDLLARTVFYKVGHHGSHNATLREKGLELMSSDELAAMLPVDRETAETMDWKMPFPTLFQRLEEKTKGRILDRDKGVTAANPGTLNQAQWQRFVERTAATEDWLDYFVEL